MLRKPDPASLKVTGQTTLAELQAFANKAGANAKIRGEPNSKDGSVTLYASTKKAGSLHSQTDRTPLQQAARDAIGTVMRGVRGGALTAVTNNVLSQLPTGEVRKADLLNAINQVTTARQNAVLNPRDRGDLGAALKDALASGNKDALDQVKRELGSNLAAYLRTKPRDAQMDAAISTGTDLKAAVLGALAAGANDPGVVPPSLQHAGPTLKAVLDEAYATATSQLSDRRLDDNTIVVNGTDYTKVRDLGAGGFGTVAVYRSATGDEIALKSQKEEEYDPSQVAQKKAEKFAEAAAEVTAHRSAVQGNPGQVIDLKGVVRLPGGRIEIALELAPKGDVDAAFAKLDTAVQNGRITPQDANLARLTLLKDMMQGLQHVVETRGMTHRDIKGPNFFVDANGVAKVGDFGTALAGTQLQVTSNPAENPRWVAPEVVVGAERYRAQAATIREKTSAGYQNALSTLDKGLKGAERDQVVQNLKSNYQAMRDNRLAALPSFTHTAKADSWSIGVEAYRAFANVLPFDGEKALDVREALEDFQSDPTNRKRLPANLNLGMSATDLGHLNTLVEGLLHPDPQQRSSMTQALQNPLLNQAGVGGPAARAVLQQVL